MPRVLFICFVLFLTTDLSAQRSKSGRGDKIPPTASPTQSGGGGSYVTTPAIYPARRSMDVDLPAETQTLDVLATYRDLIATVDKLVAAGRETVAAELFATAGYLLNDVISNEEAPKNERLRAALALLNARVSYGQANGSKYYADDAYTLAQEVGTKEQKARAAYYKIVGQLNDGDNLMTQDISYDFAAELALLEEALENGLLDTDIDPAASIELDPLKSRYRFKELRYAYGF